MPTPIQSSIIFHDGAAGSFPSNPTNGSAIIVCASRYQGGIDPGQVTDSKGNAYSQSIHLQRGGSSDERVAIFAALNIVGGAGLTFSIAVAGNGTTFCAIEVPAVLTSLALDDTNPNSASGTPNSGLATGTTADAIAIGAFTHANASAAFAPVGPGWVAIAEEEDNSAFQALGASYKILTSTGDQQATWSGTFDYAAVIAIFKGIGGGGGGGNHRANRRGLLGLV